MLNTLVFAGSSGVGVVVTLILTPLLINRLGATPYGVWILATTLSYGLGYLALSDLGVEEAVVRFVASARAGRDRHRVAVFSSGALVILTTVALVLTPILVAVAPLLVGIFEIPEPLTDDAVLAFRLVALQLIFDLPGRAFVAVLQGAQDYFRWQGIEVTRTLLTAGSLGTVALLGYGIVGLAVASLAASAFVFALTVLVALRAVPEARPSPKLAERGSLRELTGFSARLFVFQFAGLVYTQTDKTIIGILLSAAAVTTYDIAYRMQVAVKLVSTVITSAVTPTAAFHERSPARLRSLFLRGTSYTVAAVFPFVLVVVLFAEPVIRTWIGSEFTGAAPVARIFVAVLALAALVTVGESILVGIGRVREMMWLNVLWVLINLPLSVALARPLGIEGVVLGTLISQLVVFFPLIGLLLRTIGASPKSFLRAAVAPVIPGIALQAGVGVLLLPLARGADSLLVVAPLALLSVGVALATFVVIGMSSDERDDLLATIRTAVTPAQ